MEVTRSRAYKKNDQAFVEQKNGAVVRRLVGYGRFDGPETAQVMARLYAAARLHVNFFQPSFKLKEKRREGARVIKRYHMPATPYERALAHPALGKKIKQRLRSLYRTLDPVALLAEMRGCQAELGARVDRRGGKIGPSPAIKPAPVATRTFASSLGRTVEAGEPRPTHRRTRRPYKVRIRMPSMLDPHVAAIEGWLVAEPRLTALTILSRLSASHPSEFGPPQQTTIQRLLKTLRAKTAGQAMVASMDTDPSSASPGTMDGSGYVGPDPPTAPTVGDPTPERKQLLGNIVR